MRNFHFYMLILIVLVLTGCTASSTSGPSNPSSVNIQNKGSDTMVNLALAWAEKYQQLHPEFRISVTGGGTGTGIASLLGKTIDIANASRAVKKEEKAEADKQGFPLKEFVVARDAIAVIINPENPVNELTLDQISKIYKGEITNWSQVGGEDRPIVRLSRETNSGTHIYFLETVIRLGNKEDKSFFSANTLLLPSSEGIISEVSDNPNAIGYDGLGYVTPNVKVLAIAAKPGEPYVLPSVVTVNNGSYSISRDLYMYTRGETNSVIDDYLNWIVSDEAQTIVADLGFVPVIK